MTNPFGYPVSEEHKRSLRATAYIEALVLTWEEANRKAAEEAEKYIELTQAELDKIYTYQHSMPTSPKPGFRYKRMQWRYPAEDTLWYGPHIQAVRRSIATQCNLPEPYYGGPLTQVWIVYTCRQDPHDNRYVLHVPKEAKVVE